MDRVITLLASKQFTKLCDWNASKQTIHESLFFSQFLLLNLEVNSSRIHANWEKKMSQYKTNALILLSKTRPIFDWNVMDGNF